MNYIMQIDLGDRGNAFAQRIGLISLGKDKYVCAAITENGEPYHNQVFTLEKSVDGLPANNKTLETDVLKGWEKHLSNIERINSHD